MKTGLDTIPLGLETARLYLRAPLADTDARVVNESIRRSHEELKRWLPFAQDVPTLSETEANLQRAQELYGTGESFRYLIFLRETGTFVGTVSLFGIDWDVPKAEIGYWLDSTHTGRGYMTEAVNRLTDFAFANLGMQRVEIFCDARNRRSAAVAERAGYTLEAQLRHHRRATDGTLSDTRIYARLREG